MYKIFYSCVIIFWICDLCNLPFMEKFDTTYPLNTLFWILVFIFLPSTQIAIQNNKEE